MILTDDEIRQIRRSIEAQAGLNKELCSYTYNKLAKANTVQLWQRDRLAKAIIVSRR